MFTSLTATAVMLAKERLNLCLKAGQKLCKTSLKKNRMMESKSPVQKMKPQIKVDEDDEVEDYYQAD